MDADQSIYEEFMALDLGYLAAIERLQKIGIDPKEAERMVSEWADAAEPDHAQFGVGA